MPTRAPQVTHHRAVETQAVGFKHIEWMGERVSGGVWGCLQYAFFFLDRYFSVPLAYGGVQKRVGRL